MKIMDVLRQRDYIFCPCCGERLAPICEGGTDGSMNGDWTCGCGARFLFTLNEEGDA